MQDTSAAHPQPLPEVGGEKTPQEVFAEFDARHPKLHGRLAAVESAQHAFWDDVNTGREAAEAAMAAPEAAPVAESTPQQSRWRRIGATVLSSVTEGINGFVGRIRTRAESTRRHDPMTIELPDNHPIAAARESGGLLLDPVSTALDSLDQQPRPVFSDIWELLQTREALVDGLDRTGDRESALPQPVRIPGQREHWNYIPGTPAAPQPGKDTTLPVRTPGLVLQRHEQQALPPDTTLFMADDARQRAPATIDAIMGIVIANARAASPVAKESLERKLAARHYNRGLDQVTHDALLARFKRKAAIAMQQLPPGAEFGSTESDRLIAQPMTAPSQQHP